MIRNSQIPGGYNPLPADEGVKVSGGDAKSTSNMLGMLRNHHLPTSLVYYSDLGGAPNKNHR
jgi:hypothetical protein